MKTTRLLRAAMLLLVAGTMAVLPSGAIADAGAQTPAVGARPGLRMPPRDPTIRGSEPETGSGRISGRVVDATSGRPIRRATVSATPVAASVGQPRRSVEARTADDGTYHMSELPDGQYAVAVRRAGFVPVSYGQTSPGGSVRRVTVDGGSRVSGIDFPLQPGGAITGRVVDEAGEPAEGVAVQAYRAQRVRGRTRYVPSGGRTAITDDLGHFRVYGLSPGEYLVAAEPSRRGIGNAPPGTPTDAEEIDTIETYAPGTPLVSDAQRFVLAAGDDASTVIQLVAARVAAVAGRAVDSSGQQIQGGTVHLVRQDEDVAVRRGRRAGIRDGAFRLDGVAPGAYTLRVVAQGRRPRDAADWPGPESAALTVAVGGDDVEGLVVVTAPPTTLSGRVVVEGDASRLAGRTFRVTARSTEIEPAMSGGQGIGATREDLTVRVTGLRGRQRITVAGLPAGWWVKDVRVNGQTAIDGFDFGVGRQMTGLEIVLSDRPASIGGLVTRSDGQPAGDYMVVVFPEAFDGIDALIGTGRGGIAYPDQHGTYVLERIRPGTYFAVAIAAFAVEPSVLDDPEALRALSDRAETVSIADGEQKYLSLRLASP